MWPFRKRPAAAPETPEVLRRLIDVEAQLEELRAKHMSLRGRVYNAGIHKKPLPDSEEAQADTVPRSKDELRKVMGFTPGRPYPHK